MKNEGGHFISEVGVHVELESGAHFKLELDGQYHWNLQISHNRYWIQDNLYQYQSLFTEIIQDKHLVYFYSPCHLDFHWETHHNPYHADLYFYYKATKDSAYLLFETFNSSKKNY
jgi:hypothetical protein